MTVAQELRRTTTKASSRIRTKEKRVRLTEVQKIEKIIKEHLAEIKRADIYKEIQAAAKAGYKRYAYPIYTMSSRTPVWAQATIEHVKNMFKDDGFTSIETSYYTLEPVGSDPISFDDLTDCHVVFSWEKKRAA